ncbi:MAG: hypothetical protein JWN76_818 [Chitinophagaceae bacterium]|nr:hypothetical protein [Chitinophagaceae bacterium]
MHMCRKHTTLIFFFILLSVKIFSQTDSSACPPNNGFEMGNFDYWVCAAGTVDGGGTVHLTPTQAINGRHTIIATGTGTDRYGNFPLLCPYGSGKSIQLGNDNVGHEAESVSYTFVIPANRDDYTITYYYAAVLQTPNHQPQEQPKFVGKMFNVTDGVDIDCGSFEFVASRNIPGFQVSPTSDSVVFKPWSPVTVNLHGYGGKTITMEFITNDCVFQRHFGYAYLDVDENCHASPITGTTYCTGNTSVSLTGPYGYAQYEWYNADKSQLLATGNPYVIKPPPAGNTNYILHVLPFDGGGCEATLPAIVSFSPEPLNLKVIDSLGSCASSGVDITSAFITAGSTAGLKYQYYTNPDLSSILYSPNAIRQTGIYYIKATNKVDCQDVKPIKVIIYDKLNVAVKPLLTAFYPHTVDITDRSIFSGNLAGITYSYWKDIAATITLPNPEAIGNNGTYYIKMVNYLGCETVLPVKVEIRIPPPPNAFSPNNDGIHDTWEIPQLELFPECTVDVYTRYGRQVYHSKGYNKPWDGKLDGEPLPIGTYYFVIKLNNIYPRFSGFLSLLK